MDSLLNKGLLIKDNEPCPDEATFVVLGLPRSGTSFLSSTLAHLGVFLGDAAYAPTYEDKFLKDAFDDGNYERLDELIAEYNAHHKRWAVKLPRATHRPAELAGRLRAPRLLVTFRDPLAVQLRMKISQGATDDLALMRRVMKQYLSFVGNLETLSVPMLLVSYDKVAKDSADAIEAIARFCGCADKLVVQTAQRAIESDAHRYVDQTRVNKTYGTVEHFDGKWIRGWIIHQNPKNKERPILQVLSGGNVVVEQIAELDKMKLLKKPEAYFRELDIRRQFVARNLRAFSGKIGFELCMSDLASGRFRLRVKGDSVPFATFDNE